MRPYKPRRASKRYLDGDCPAGVLAIFDDGPNGCTDRYTIFYVGTFEYDNRTWLNGFGTSADLGFSGTFEMMAHQVADYRFRNNHRATQWTKLPKAVQDRVREYLVEFAV